MTQYIFYPFSIGGERIHELDVDIKNLFSQFKLIYFSLIPLVISLFLLIRIKEKSLIQKKEFTILLIFLGSVIIFIYCQLLTLNQVLIFFLIPISAAFSHAFTIKYFNKSYIINY